MELVDQLGDRLRQLTWQGRPRRRRHVGQYGLALPQLVVLTKVSQLGTAAMSAVCDTVQLPRSSMTSITDRLVEVGLVSAGPARGRPA